MGGGSVVVVTWLVVVSGLVVVATWLVVVGGQCVDVDEVKPDASAWSWAIRSELLDMTAHHRHAARRL